MTADQHPALVAAVEALEWALAENERRGNPLRLTCNNTAERALALLRAAMEKAETKQRPSMEARWYVAVPAEPVCFVPTGADVKPGEFWSPWGEQMTLREDKSGFPLGPGYRRLEPGWLAESMERLRQLDWAQFREEGDMLLAGPNDAEIRAALFPPSEPEPEAWITEAATTWFRIPFENRDAAALAAHFAKARRAREV